MGAIKAKKTKAKKTSSKSSLGSRLAGAAVSAFTGGSTARKGGGRRRNRGPAYWANKVLVEKLKKRYNRLKYGGAR